MLLLIEQKIPSIVCPEVLCACVCETFRHSVDSLAWGFLLPQQLSLVIRIKVIIHTYTQKHTLEQSGELWIWFIEGHRWLRLVREHGKWSRVHTHQHAMHTCSVWIDVDTVCCREKLLFQAFESWLSCPKAFLMFSSFKIDISNHSPWCNCATNLNLRFTWNMKRFNLGLVHLH